MTRCENEEFKASLEVAPNRVNESATACAYSLNCTAVSKTTGTCNVRENDHRKGSIEVTAITLDLGSRTPITFTFIPASLLASS